MPPSRCATGSALAEAAAAFTLMLALVVPGRCAAAEAITSPCMGFTAEHAAIILGVDAAELRITSGGAMLPNLCRVVSTTDLLKQVSFSVYQEADGARAQQELEAVKSGLSFLSSMEAVDGLGDAAWWAGDDRARRLLVRQGNLFIDVVNPRDLEQQKAVVRQLLQKK